MTFKKRFKFPFLDILLVLLLGTAGYFFLKPSYVKLDRYRSFRDKTEEKEAKDLKRKTILKATLNSIRESSAAEKAKLETGTAAVLSETEYQTSAPVLEQPEIITETNPHPEEDIEIHDDFPFSPEDEWEESPSE